MKFKDVRVLNDPRAEIEKRLLTDDRELQDRVSDADLIDEVRKALEAPSSLDAFYSADIRDSNGRLHQISDCAANARKALKVEEARHIGFIDKIINAFRSGQVELGTDRDRHQAILDLLEGRVIQLKQRGASHALLREKVITDMYIYWSYVFHRALKYYKSGKTSFDRNDYEDGQICLHLELSTPFCVVTKDRGMREALDETVALLNRLDDPQIRTTLRVMKYDLFFSIAQGDFERSGEGLF